MNTYMSGSLVRTIATFTDITGSVADPDTITLKYRTGAGTVSTTTGVTKDDTGVYHYDLDTSGFSGPDDQLWVTEWAGTGAVQAINSDSFQIIAPAL